MPNLDPAGFPSTPRLLLDANSIGQADGSDVSSWSDLSGNGNNGSASSGSRPKFYNSSNFGNIPLVRFDNSKVLTGSFNAWGSANGTLLMVVSSYAGAGSGASSFGGIFSGVKSGDANDFNSTGSFCLAVNSSNNEYWQVDNNGTSQVITLGDLDTPCLFGAVLNGASSRYLVGNFRGSTSTSSNNLALATWGIGQRWNSSAWTTGQGAKFDLHALVLFDTGLTAANQILAIDYMMEVVMARAGTSGGGLMVASGMNGGFPR